jgi:hypothetical protein
LKGSVQRVKRTFVAVVLAVVLVLALAAPALAQAIYHTATYEMDGTIDFKKQAGHYCNTGAEIKQVIAGQGKMDKVQTITQVKGKITMDDTNDWVAGATALTVTTVWKLCTPPKYTYNDADDTYGYDVPVAISSIYNHTRTDQDMPASWGDANAFDSQDGRMSGVTHEMLAEKFGWDAVSDQYWAVQVKADPGFSGNVHQKGEAAYGPFWSNGSATGFAYDDSWKEYGVNNSNAWRWEMNKDGDILGASVGANYVGDYFHMEQMARTSQGTLKRHIDLSSPWSHAYLYEDMSVVGKSSITEAIKFDNLPAGKDVPKDWWKLF